MQPMFQAKCKALHSRLLLSSKCVCVLVFMFVCSAACVHVFMYACVGACMHVYTSVDHTKIVGHKSAIFSLSCRTQESQPKTIALLFESQRFIWRPFGKSKRDYLRNGDRSGKYDYYQHVGSHMLTFDWLILILP